MKFIILAICMVLMLPTYAAAAPFKKVEFDALEVIPLQSTGLIEVNAGNENRTMTVNHEVKNGDVYIECLISAFTFTKEKVGHAHKDGEGHIRLYINGHHVDTVFQGAFIIKGLPTGNHEVKIEVVKNDKTSYDLEETITVSIP